MLEVVFNESAQGALKAAQHCTSSDKNSVAGEFFLSDEGSVSLQKEMDQAQWQTSCNGKHHKQRAAALGGSSKDVFCFCNDLSVGDISGDCLSEERVRYASDTYSLFPEECTAYLSDIQTAKITLDELIRRSSVGETIRIWYSEQPHEYCGMCWLISQLKKRMVKLPRIAAIKLPNQVESGDTIIEYTGWGEVRPEKFHEFLPLQKEVTAAFAYAAALKWGQLQQQNTSLRAVINGTLLSVPEDFYDPFIKTEMDKMDNEFNEAFLIGNVLGKYQLGIGDMWIALRIEKMMEDGILIPLTNPKQGCSSYRRMLKKIS